MFEIVGIENVSGVYEGCQYSGTRFHCMYTKKNTDGYAVTSVYCKSSILADVTIQIGDVVEFLYDSFGKVAHISKKDSKYA